MKRIAILLGSESYKEYKCTDFCYSDVELLRQTLENYCDYSRDDIYSDNLYMGLENSQKDTIYNIIDDRMNELQAGDTVLFYYAGHGIVHNSKAYLVLPDTEQTDIEHTAINIDELKNHFVKNNVSIFWIFDACHSGNETRDADEGLFNNYVFGNSTIATLASCSIHEKSYIDSEKQQGVFTYYLCSTIRKMPANSEIYLEALKVSVCRSVEVWCQEKEYIQHPTMNIVSVGNKSIGKRNEREDFMEETSIVLQKNTQLDSIDSFKELMDTLNPDMSLGTPTGLILPTFTNIPALIEYAVRIPAIERGRIQRYYSEGDFMTSAEKVWNRAMAELKTKVLSLGDDFVADMLGIDDVYLVRSLEGYMFIRLANQLGFIDDHGEMSLRHANEYMNYYLSNSNEEDLPQDEANIIIKNAVKYIVGINEEHFGFEFNDFRNKLKVASINDTLPDINLLVTSPYFFKKTTVRTLLNLFKATDGIEYENVVENMSVIFPLIWESLVHDDKYFVGETYSQYENKKDDKRVKSLKSVLVKVHGFDYVPENTRSTIFTNVATRLIAVHYAYDNFYNEPLAISNLEKLGSKFPKPALRICMTAILLVKLGNRYGTSGDAQSYADNMLDRLTSDDWRTYLEHYLPNEKDLVDDLYTNPIPRMVNRWNSLVEKYDLKCITVTNKVAKRLLSI